MRALLLCLFLTLPLHGETLARLQDFDANLKGGKLVLRFQASEPLDSAVYFRSWPERLVVELIDADMNDVRAGSLPRSPAIAGLQLKQADLNHVFCELELRHRIPSKNVDVKRDGNSLTVTANLEYENEDSFSLTKAVRWVKRETANSEGYLLWNELVVNLQDPAARLEVGVAKERLDAREKPTAMVSRYKAVGGVNGGYFATSGGPLGIVAKGGKLLSPHVSRRPPRTVLGVLGQGRVEMDQMVATPAGSLASRGGATWSDVQLALGGGPRLLHRGQVALTTDEEELGPKGNDITRVAARTAVATTRDGKVILVTATGYRDNHLQGLRLEELASRLVRRGCQDAMNLDGGASTIMAIGDDVVSNGPGAPRKQEKEVATALLVMDAREASYPAVLKTRLEREKLNADGSDSAKLTVEVLDNSGKPVPDGTVVRFYPYHCQAGAFAMKVKDGQVSTDVRSVRSVGPALVRVECGGVREEVNLKMESGPAARLLVRVSPARACGAGVQELAVTAQVNDAVGNPAAGVNVTLDSEEGLTGANGQKTFLLKVPVTGAQMTLRAEGVKEPIQIDVPALVEPTPAPQK